MIKSNTGYVYLINEIDTNNFKIGISKKPASDGRIKNLQTGNHNKLIILFEIKSKCHTTLEKTLHRTYSDKHLRGEWFNLPNPDIVINEIIKTNNNLELLLENYTYL
jgi:hypothetical protein